jgi:alkylation response protein AidB-like acyl-CoA dehydrogenase
MSRFPETLVDIAILDQIDMFCLDVLASQAAAIDRSEISANCHRRALSDVGLMGLNLPSDYGGAGVDPFTLFEAVAAMSGACASTGSMVTAHFLATDSILYGGDADQQRHWLPRAATGDALGAFALTEPGAGSNPADMTTTAQRDGTNYHLRGTKHFISNAGEADFIIVYVKTSNDGAKGISAFIVEPRAGGVQISAREPTMGLRGGHIYEVTFDCLVPATNRLGNEGTGFRTALKVLDAGRLDIAACCIGIAEAAFAAALDWAKNRSVGGGPIGQLQGIQWMFADMATDIAAARGLSLVAATKRGSGQRFSLEASMAKLFASEMVARVTDQALQIHGGYGYCRSLPLERYSRDARIMRIYEGSSEVQRNIIARTLLG